MRESSYPSLFQRYAVAVGLTLLALLLRWLFIPIVGNSTPFVLVAIMMSAWYGGLGPGIFSTCLTSLFVIFFAHWFPTPTPTAMQAGGIPSALTLLIIGVMVSFLQESLHRAHRRTTQSAKMLKASNDRFHLLVDSVRDYGIFMLDPEGKIASWNRGAQQINGYTADEIIGQHFSRFYPAPDVASGKPDMELVVATEVGRFEEEGWRVRKDGSRFWASVIITAVRDEEDELRGFSKVTRDMTERKQAEERYQMLIRAQTARAEAENANRAKDEFLSILSHELRTPLNSILGWANLLGSGGLDAETEADALATIERNARIQARLVDDLLDVSRMISGKLFMETHPTPLAPLIEAVANTMRPAAEEKDVELRLNLTADVAPVQADPTRLEQVIWNLVSNAIKFTPEGGRVEVGLTQTATHAQITVSDTGRGISPDVLPFIFDRFRQADSSSTRQYGGLGLGLTIVRHVIEAHGGTIQAESLGTDQGATFTIQIPFQTAPMENLLPQKGSIAPLLPAASGNGSYMLPSSHSLRAHTATPADSTTLQGLQVLIVDDEEDNLDVISTILKGSGAIVRTASSATDALTVLNQWKPEALVADIGMFGEDGYSLISRVRTLNPEQGSEIPALALTAYCSTIDRRTALAAGYQEHLAKPVEPGTLVATIARLAGR